jgi:hypothetical protein
MFLWHVFYFYLPCIFCEWVFIFAYLVFTHGFSFFLTQDLRLATMLVEVPNIKWLPSFDGKCLQQRPTLHENLQKGGSGKSGFLLWWLRGNFVTLRNVLWITLIYDGILFSLLIYNMILSHGTWGSLCDHDNAILFYFWLNFCCNQNDNDT